MVETGLAYAEGDGVTPDLKQALLWYRKGIDAGSNRAMLALGDAYEHGKGIAQDLEQAVDWYRKAAESGGPGLENVFAMHRLSRAYGQSKRIPLTYDVLIDQREMIRLLDALEKGVRMVTMRHSLANKNAGFSANNLIT